MSSNTARSPSPSTTPSPMTPAGDRLRIAQFQSKQFGDPVVVVRNLHKSFHLEGSDEEVHALSCVNIDDDSPIGAIRRGEFIMIRGPSGGGKTTLLNILGTIDEPTQGCVEIFGQRVDAQSSDAYLADLRLQRIGFVFQTFNLLATMSAFENVELPMTILGRLSRSESRKRAMKLLDMVGLGDRYSHLPSELSGGEQQRVTIARALANEPQILLLDEPTGDLDTKNTVEIMNLILAVNQRQKTTCIMVTHNSDLECYADRILYVEDGAFQRQAVNAEQTALEFEHYMQHVNKMNSQH